MKKTEIYADYHVHTHISPCGKKEATAQTLIKRASEKGFAALGFADHYTPQSIPGCSFYDTQRIDILTKLRKELRKVKIPRKMEVLVGVEVDYTLAGTKCLDSAALRECDHIIGAASHFHLPSAPTPAENTARSKAELMVRMAYEMLALPGISVWAHPFDCGGMRPLGPILAEISEDTLADLIAVANRTQVSIEINGGAGLCQEYREVTAPFFCLAREMGARFTLTSDAHHPKALDRLDLALDWAKAMGFQKEDFVSAHELQTIQQNKVAVVLAGRV